MPGIVLKHLKRNQLPPTWRKGMFASSGTLFRVVVDPEGSPDEDALLKAELLPQKSGPKRPAEKRSTPVIKAVHTAILAKLSRGKGREDSAQWIALIKAGRTRSELKTPLS